jgi:hypothetical protein
MLMLQFIFVAFGGWDGLRNLRGRMMEGIDDVSDCWAWLSVSVRC